MSTSTYDFVHLALHAMDGTIQGKTKLQKTIYFLGLLSGNIDDLGYRAHFYGPYSDDVSNAVGQLMSNGFVEPCRTVWGIDPQGFEISRTDYQLSSDGERMATTKAAQNPDLWEKIHRAADVIKNCGDQGYMKLSVAAKTFFMLNHQGSTASTDDLASLAGKFGWKVTKAQVDEAATLLQSLGLVEISSS